MSIDWEFKIRIKGRRGEVEIQQALDGGRQEVRERLIAVALETYKNLEEE